MTPIDAFQQKRQSEGEEIQRARSASRPTKRRLLACIAKDGLVGVRFVGDGRYHVRLPEDPDPAGGVWISLSSTQPLEVDYGDAIVRIAGAEIRLTRAEADQVANFVRSIMRRRLRPPRLR